ncbi:NAD-specific glutamate dehydrogenase [compost metagenome]
MNHHGRLAILVSGELLGAGNRYGGVTRNHLLHQPTHGLKPKGQGDHVEQQQFATIAAIAGQGIGLDCRANGNHLIGVDIGQRRTAKQGAYGLTYTRHTGRTTDHDHCRNFFELDTAVTHGATAGLETAGYQWFDQGIECSAGQLGLPVAVSDSDRVSVGQGFLGGASGLQQLALGSRIKIRRQTGLLDNPAGDGMVEIIAAQGAVATGGKHFKHAAGQAQDGNIEGTAAQVVNGHQAFSVLVQAIGHGCSSRLVEQAQHVQPGQTRRILGSLALGVVEIGRHGDYRAHQLATQGFFSALTQHLEDIGRDFHRAFRALHGVDERHVRLTADKAVRQLLTQLLDVCQATAHQALDRQHGIEWVAGCGVTRYLTDIDVVGMVTHGRRQDDPTLSVGQGLAAAAAQCCDQGVGGAKVNPHRQATLVRLRALTGFGDLQ